MSNIQPLRDFFSTKAKLVNLIKSFWFLFLDTLFPPWCLTCEATLIRHEKGICLTCLQDIFSQELLSHPQCCFTSSMKGLAFFEAIKKVPSYRDLLEASFLIYLLNQNLTPKSVIIDQDNMFRSFKLDALAACGSFPFKGSLKDHDVILLAFDQRHLDFFEAYCACSCVKSFRVCYIEKVKSCN